jgi:hypothetical protein
MDVRRRFTRSLSFGAVGLVGALGRVAEELLGKMTMQILLLVLRCDMS